VSVLNGFNSTKSSHNLYKAFCDIHFARAGKVASPVRKTRNALSACIGLATDACWLDLRQRTFRECFACITQVHAEADFPRMLCLYNRFAAAEWCVSVLSASALARLRVLKGCG